MFLFFLVKNVEVDDDTAIVWGEADSQATKERVILVLGIQLV